jgi:hypothetical protein
MLPNNELPKHATKTCGLISLQDEAITAAPSSLAIYVLSVIDVFFYVFFIR